DYYCQVWDSSTKYALF
nr:immunoglobulin light chain junction region [Macaca mulatta]MOW03998.1 immunoglobulin light chain junction region [Macaca mulatta]MOW04039.1 immunoglobulin light chain junction region [Macaca mulatta]MOW04218.1 immunoglobulin light chain junction region [Macaca mulatta]MOW04379.1 immunoglobulin light chain junction region [Macaca mulatta]